MIIMENSQLLLGEAFLLLALKEKKSSLPLNGKGLFLDHIFPTTILMDLHILGRIGVAAKKRKIYVIPIDPTPVNEPILDEVLQLVINLKNRKGASKVRTITKWIEKLGKQRRYWEHYMWNKLEFHGIIHNKGRKHVYQNVAVRNQVIGELRNVVINQLEPNLFQSALIGLMFAGLGWHSHFKRSERNVKWCKNITDSQIFSQILKWNVITKKKATFSSGMMNAGATIRSAGNHVLNASNQSVDLLMGTKTFDWTWET